MGAKEATHLNIRLHREELVAIHRIAAFNGVPAGTVVRAFVRHFLIQFEQGRPAPVELGAISWSTDATGNT